MFCYGPLGKQTIVLCSVMDHLVSRPAGRGDIVKVKIIKIKKKEMTQSHSENRWIGLWHSRPQ